MLKEIKKYYSRIYDKTEFRHYLSGRIGITAESIRVNISSGTMPKKHQATTLLELKKEVLKQHLNEKKALDMEVNL